MYAELVINIEAGLVQTFHYHVPADLTDRLCVGHLVEVEFGRRLAQGIVVGLDTRSPVEDTKPVISLIDEKPIVLPWQIELARWMSRRYLAPLNGCLRLFMPPGLTRWASNVYDLNPDWDGTGRLTEAQELLIELLNERGDLRDRQIAKAVPKEIDWRSAANQLVRRSVLRRASVLDPPRVRPKVVRTAELIAGPRQIAKSSIEFGRRNLKARVLYHLLWNDDPLPSEQSVREATGAKDSHLVQLEQNSLIFRDPPKMLAIPVSDPAQWPVDKREALSRLPTTVDEEGIDPSIVNLHHLGLVELIDQPAALALSVSSSEAVAAIFELKGGATYHRLLAYLAKAAAPVPLTEVYSATGAKIYHLRKLADAGLIRLGSEEVWRDPLADRDYVPSDGPRLTSDQTQVWDAVRSQMETSEGKPLLLYGVTGSGKTEIYLRATEMALDRDQSAIILVPEIALTPQTVRRFAARFPGRVAVLHSRLSDGERYDTWRRAREGLFDVIVGPRSALFTHLDNVGVIVLDEEHDHSYKQTPPVPPPYYHARETAIELGHITGATVVLGSATPDLVTYHRAQAGTYRLLELPKRIMGHRQRIASQSARLGRDSNYRRMQEDPEDALTIPLPPIQIVDLRQELRAGNRSVFSRALRKSLDETLDRGEQAILFLNRRGTATFIMCRDCGLVLNCPRCEMPLTYHRPGMMLQCHYCGRKEQPSQECPRCGSHRVKYFGLGTEELQRLVQQEWPEARTVRWDRDTTAGRDRHESLLASFINHEADILVGTQMIAKGLDLPLVTLVGVVSADVALGLPDFRMGERIFQNLTQVAGRAGRGLLGGQVIIQTYQPEHYAIQAAARHDYLSFYLDEIRFRTQHGLPPFRRLAKFLIIDPVDSRAENRARRLARAISAHIREKGLGATELYGPTPPFFNRIDGRYRWQILVRSPDPNRLLEDFDVPAPWIVDIDPVSVL